MCQKDINLAETERPRALVVADEAAVAKSVVDRRLIDLDERQKVASALPVKKDSSCSCDDSLKVIVQKEYNSVFKQINNRAFPNSPSINCTISGTFLKIQNINEKDLANLELLLPSYQNYGINFTISLFSTKVLLIDLTPNVNVIVAGLNQIMNNYVQYNEVRHDSSTGKFKPFEYDVNDSKFNQSVPQITDTLSEVDVHCLTTYGHVKNYDVLFAFHSGATRDEAFYAAYRYKAYGALIGRHGRLHLDGASEWAEADGFPGLGRLAAGGPADNYINPQLPDVVNLRGAVDPTYGHFDSAVGCTNCRQYY